MIIITIHSRSLRFFETVTQLVSSDNRQAYLRADYKISLKGWHTHKPKGFVEEMDPAGYIRFDIQMKPIGAMRIGRCVRVGESRTPSGRLLLAQHGASDSDSGGYINLLAYWSVFNLPAFISIHHPPYAVVFLYTIVRFSLCCDSIPISLKWAHPAKVSSVFGCTGWAKKSGRWRILITPIEKYV